LTTLEDLLNNFRHAALDANACGNDFGTGQALADAEDAILKLFKTEVGVMNIKVEAIQQHVDIAIDNNGEGATWKSFSLFLNEDQAKDLMQQLSEAVVKVAEYKGRGTGDTIYGEVHE
jgi:hypothetical protein